MNLDEFAEQVRSLLDRKADDVDTAKISAGPIFDDAQVVIDVECFDGHRYAVTVEAV